MPRWSALLCSTAIVMLVADMAKGEDNPFNNSGGLAGQENTVPRAPDKPEILRVQISRSVCRRLAIETRSANVAYVPGVDVRGNAVKSADLQTGFQYTLPDVIEFPITINPIEFQAARREATAQQDLADRLSENPAELTALEEEAFNQTLADLEQQSADVEAELALIQTDFDTREAAIIAATGGANPSNPELVQRNQALALLQEDVFGSETFQDLSAQQSSLATQISQQSVGLQQVQTVLATEQTTVTAARDVFINDFETREAAIIAATGGDLQTDPGALTDRAAQIAALENEIFGSAAFLEADTAFQTNAAAIAVNESALASNQTDQQALQDEAAAFDATQAQISADAAADGVFSSNESTITVAQVRFDVLSGRVTLNGEALLDATTLEVLERCEAAGFLP